MSTGTSTAPDAPRLLQASMTRLDGWRRAVARRTQGETLMLGLAVMTGLFTGLLASALIEVIAAVQALAFGESVGPLKLILVPTIGAFLVGIMLTYAVPESSGSGVIQIMSTIAMRGGRFRTRVPFGGVLASGLALGTGAAGGREGPIVLIGGATGSLLGRFFNLDESRLRALVAAGAAAGIGASFNAPIGGMLFAVELIVGGFRAASLQTIVVASVVGSVTARQLVGPEIIFRPDTTYRLNDTRELLLYLVLGLASVGIGIGFLYMEDFSKKAFARMKIWRPFKLAIGGLAIGVIALGVPEILGTGDKLPPIDGIRDPVQTMLNGQIGVGYLAAGTLLLFVVAKMVATSIAIGSGTAIGTFAPVIFTGAALGGAIGHVAQQLLPNAGVEPGAFALVGMAAAFGAAARAPLTSIVIAFELTGDYELVLPLMLATGIATFLADRINPDSIYTHPLRQRGIIYREPEDIDILQTVRVGEVMTSNPDTLRSTDSLADVEREFTRSGHHGFPVLDPADKLLGVLTVSDLERARELHGDDDGALAALTAADLCTRDPVTVTPDHPAFRAVQRMATLDVGRLPVVATDDRRRLVGLIRRSDLVKAYRRAVSRSTAAQQRRESSQLRDLVGVHFVERSVEPGAPAADQKVRDISWPERTVLTSIRRDGQIVMPNGDTTLEPGDEVVILTHDEADSDIRRLLARGHRGGEDGERPRDGDKEGR